MSELITFKILSGEHGNIAQITLNKPQALNAINISMIDAIQTHLDTCENDDTIKCVVIQGAGDKAFCAGGDIIGLYHSMQETAKNEVPEKAALFFNKEYKMDYRLHTFPKPIIAWADGIVMGGGIGIMAACSHRIVTENSMLAMPEVTIGLYPDVAASWFFNRMPKNIGMFLGLTGVRINASDAVFCKLADNFILNKFKDKLLENLATIKWSDNLHCDVQNIINIHTKLSKNDIPISNLQENYDEIQDLLAPCNLIDIVSNLTQAQPTTKWLGFAQKSFLKGCPVTYALVYEQIKRAKHMSLKQVFAMELIMSTRCVMNPDLPEGIRALLIDKDGKPKWSVTSIDEITDEQIAEYFISPWNKHPLK